MPANIFRNTGKLILFLIGGANISPKMQSKDQLAFLQNQQQLVNSGCKIPFP